MLNAERREKMIVGPEIYRGVAEAKENFDNIPKGVSGLITAYLPEQNTFAVVWPQKDLSTIQSENLSIVIKDSVLITYKMTEEEFENVFRLSAMDEVLFI